MKLTTILVAVGIISLSQVVHSATFESIERDLGPVANWESMCRGGDPLYPGDKGVAVCVAGLIMYQAGLRKALKLQGNDIQPCVAFGQRALANEFLNYLNENPAKRSEDMADVLYEFYVTKVLCGEAPPNKAFERTP